MKTRVVGSIGVLGCFVGGLIAPLSAATVAATIVVKEGDMVDGAPVSSLNGPFTNGLGEVGFTGAVDRGTTDNFVWSGGGPIWFGSNAAGLSGAEASMGIGNSGEFIYSPSVNGDDAVWTQDGELLVDGDPAPGFPGLFNSFNSRPSMIPDGTAYWVAGTSTTSGGTTTGRVLYRSADTATPTIIRVLASGDLVGGVPIDFPSGVGFDYQISDDGSHHIHDLLLDTGSTTNDGAIYVDGAIIAREASATGDGNVWDNFDVVAINNSGDYLFSGDLDGATTTDEFLAYNGTIVIREGDTVDGVILASSASVRAASLNNLGQAIHAWAFGGTTDEVLFFAEDASDLASSVEVLRTGDMIDVDDDGLGDFTVTDFNASNIIAPGLWLAENATVYIEIEIDDGTGAVDAIVCIRLPTPLIFFDGFESENTAAWSNTVDG